MLLSVVGLTLAMSSLAVAQAGDICDAALEQPQHPPVAVAFPADSADLQPRERDRLKRLVPQFLGSHNLKLCIIAQADRQGDDDYNRRLAEQRAAAVAEALAEEGLPHSVILLDVGAAEDPSYHALERRILVLEALR